MLSHSNDITDQRVRGACARSARNYFTRTFCSHHRGSKEVIQDRRGTSWSQALLGEVGAVQQAQVVLQSVGALAFAYCALYVARWELLHKSMRKQVVGYLFTALAQEKHLPALHSVDDSLRFFSDAFRATSGTMPLLLFLRKLASRGLSVTCA